MKYPDHSLIHHINIYHDAHELTREKLSVWSKIYDKIELLSQQFTFDPIARLRPLSKEQSFVVLVTGKDVFLGIYNHETNTICNHVDLDKVLYSSDMIISQLCSDLENKNLHRYAPIAPDIAPSLGKYIAQVRAEESLISRLPKGAVVTHTNEPFVIEIHKDPPFSDHDFMFQIDQNTHKCRVFVDGQHISPEELAQQYNRANNLFSAIISVCNGDNLSKQHAESILDISDISIEE